MLIFHNHRLRTVSEMMRLLLMIILEVLVTIDWKRSRGLWIQRFLVPVNWLLLCLIMVRMSVGWFAFLGLVEVQVVYLSYLIEINLGTNIRVRESGRCNVDPLMIEATNTLCLNMPTSIVTPLWRHRTLDYLESWIVTMIVMVNGCQ